MLFTQGRIYAKNTLLPWPNYTCLRYSRLRFKDTQNYTCLRYSRPRFKDAHVFFFGASLTWGIVLKIPGTVSRLPWGQRRLNLRQMTRHCSRNTSISRKHRKSDHTAAGGWKFHLFLVVKVDLPLTSQTVLLPYCERSGVSERRLHMTAVFCCGCWWLCCVRCCGFCVLQILFCPRPQNPCMDRPQGHWWTDVTSWDLNLHVGSPHGFKPAADEPLADGRNLSIPARSSVSSSRPLSVQLCRCTTAVILGGPWGKNPTPYDNCISAAHLAFGKNVVFKAGSLLKVSVFKAGTTVCKVVSEFDSRI